MLPRCHIVYNKLSFVSNLVCYAIFIRGMESSFMQMTKTNCSITSVDGKQVHDLTNFGDTKYDAISQRQELYIRGHASQSANSSVL